MAAALLLPACSQVAEQRPEILWQFGSGRVLDNGESVALDTYGVPDPSCYEYRRIETDVVDETLVVKLIYLGPAEEQFCTLGCPLGLTREVFDLDRNRMPGMRVEMHPDTTPHCSQVSTPSR